jgi:phytoene dehydrogenase-like protein
MAEYDGIVIGAGHNGLILQAYLGRAGLKTLCIERRHVAGGGLSTLEDPRHPGFLHNTHAFFQRAITAMPWYADLELERRGARYIEPELNVALLTRDGGALEWWTDIERTIASFAEFSRRDAETLRRWQHEFVPILRDILVREVDLRTKGFGHHIAALLASPAKAQMSRGGSAALARALEAAVREAGGDIMLMTEPARIVVENGRAAGVETAAGDVLRARTLLLHRSTRRRRSSTSSTRRWCRARCANRWSASNTICSRPCLPCI